MADGVMFYLDSGANIHSCRREFLSWDGLGFTEEEWDEMSDIDQDGVAKEIMFQYLDWGCYKSDGESE